MEKSTKILTAVVTIFFVYCAVADVALAVPYDCIDSCETGCVTIDPNPRILARCNGKCRIRCAPLKGFESSEPHE